MIRVTKMSSVFPNYFQPYLYVNEVTFGKPLWTGLVARTTNLDWRVGAFSPTPQPPGRGEGLEVEFRHQWASDLINHACVTKPLVWRTSRLQTRGDLGEGGSQGRGGGSTSPCATLLSGCPSSFPFTVNQ